MKNTKVNVDFIPGSGVYPETSENAPLIWNSLDDFKRMREVFDKVGYSEEGIGSALGTTEHGSIGAQERAAWVRKTRGGSKLETLIRLFLLDMPVVREQVRNALSPLPVEQWAEIGLITIEGEMVAATMHLTPYQALLLANDITGRNDSRLQSNYVMGIGSSSKTLANLTVRRHGIETLDLGTGCGIQAFLASPHSASVCAVDRNPRAVNITAFNALLNGLTNVDVLQGDLFEPVKNRKFDLVISNPPFVISPDTSYIFRDSGLPGDQICRKIVCEVAPYLKEGAYFQMLCNWAHVEGQDWRERLGEWFKGTGCDAWALRCETRTTDVYASTWIQHTERSDEDDRSHLYDSWMDYYEASGIEAVCAGLIMMRKRTDAANWFFADDAPARMLGPCGDAVARGFELRSFLRDYSDENSFLNQPLRVGPDVVLETQFTPSEEGWVMTETALKFTSGLAYNFAITPNLAGLIAMCRQGHSLHEILNHRDPESGEPSKSFSQEELALLRELVARGFLLPELII